MKGSDWPKSGAGSTDIVHSCHKNECAKHWVEALRVGGKGAYAL